MSDWVHCNVCSRQPGDGLKYCLTSCGHIYCEKCMASATNPKCKMCGTKCSSILLSSKMKPDVELYFTDPGEILRKQYKQLQQVLDFQKSHRSRFIGYTKEKLRRQEGNQKRSQELQQYEAKIRELQRENSVLKEENSYLRKLVSNKPPSRGSGSPRVSSQTHRRSPSPSQGGGNQVLVTSGRISVRTPPSLGRASPTHLSQSSCSPGQPLMARTGLTPSVFARDQSPMQTSPSSRRSSMSRQGGGDGGALSHLEALRRHHMMQSQHSKGYGKT